jgi:uncharacterized protein (TIGR00251 family)
METVSIAVRVQPNAARSEVVGFTDDVLALRVAAPPVQGKANRALVELLSRSLGVSRGRIDIVKGHTSRNKVVTVAGLSRADIMERLSPA